MTSLKIRCCICKKNILASELLFIISQIINNPIISIMPNKILLIISLFLISLELPAQQLKESSTNYKKDCYNCKFLLNEAGKTYKKNFETALNKNDAIHRYAKTLIDFNKISDLKSKACKAYIKGDKNTYYHYFEKLKRQSSEYITKFSQKTNSDAHIYIELKHFDSNEIDYNVYVDSGVKYGSIRIYYNLETNKLAHIKIDGISYKSYMNGKNKKSETTTIWLFNNFNTLAFAMNKETKADKDFLNICEDFIEYKTDEQFNKLNLVGSNSSTTINVSLDFEKCE